MTGIAHGQVLVDGRLQPFEVKTVLPIRITP